MNTSENADPEPIRWSMNEDELRQLLTGKVVVHDNVEICLQDIGLERIYDLVADIYCKVVLKKD